MTHYWHIDESDMPPLSAACLSCAHLGAVLDDLRFSCTAFPAGIPEEISSGQNDHRASVDGDQGIRWQLHPDLIGVLVEADPGSDCDLRRANPGQVPR